MILNDKQIKEYINKNILKINPTPQYDQIQPSSIDLTLDNEYLIPQKYNNQPINPQQQSTIKYKYLQQDKIILAPHEFILATTKEHIELPSTLVGRVEGRSSIGRLGLTIHVTAGYIDPGFKGNITLEIANLSLNEILLDKGLRICQLVLEEIEEPERVYGECGNKYQGQKGVTGSLIGYDKI